MPIDVKCPQCGSGLDVPDTAAGKKRAPDCGAVIAVAPPVTEDEAGDVLLEGDPDRAIAATTVGGAVGGPSPPRKAAATPRRGRRPAAAPSLLRPPRNVPARVGSAFALLSLVPGFALLFGPIAILLGLVGLITGRFKGMARGTRDVVAAVGIGLLTTAGNVGLGLYVLSVLGPGKLVERLFDPDEPPPRRPGGADLGLGADADPFFPHQRDPFADPEEKPNPAAAKSLRVAGEDVGVRFSADGKRAVIGHGDNVDLWELESERHRPFAGGKGVLAFSPDGKWLAVGGEDDLRGKVRLYDWDSDECRKTLTSDGSGMPGPGPGVGFSSPVAFSRDGSLLAHVNNQRVRLWRTADWEELPTGIRGDFVWVERMAVSADGSTLAVSANGPFITGHPIAFWDTRQGKQTGRLDGGDSPLVGLAFASDGKSLASADWHEVKMWDVGRRTVIWSARDQVHAAFGATLVFSPDGRLFATYGPDDVLLLTEVVTGKRVATVGGGRPGGGRYGAVGFGDGGGTLLLSNGGAVEFWDVAELIKQGPRAKPPAR